MHNPVLFFCSFEQLEKLIEKNYFLHRSAQEAYKSYVRAYASHSLKTIFNVGSLDLASVCKAFGFKIPPYVDLSILSMPGEAVTSYMHTDKVQNQ